MIKLSGALTVRSINGRNGLFQVGRIATSIGEFTVKDALLEQYEDGRYDGDFGVSKIYPVSYMTGGRLVIEIRAQIESIALESIALQIAANDTNPVVERDPIDEQSSHTTDSPVTATSVTAEPETVSADTQCIPPVTFGDDDANLFGELWPLNQSVKLDPTIDRVKFRAQRDRLKALGYKFQPLGQTWALSTTA